jgi:hypothetical protein
MTVDIFKFWSEIERDEHVHPRDRDVLSRVDHNFDLRCLPTCFSGPLKTAPVVLLYLSPGWTESDVEKARIQEERDYYHERRKGHQPLSGKDRSGWKWWTSRTAKFGKWEQLQSKIAVLNIGAYHSKKFVDIPLLAALPSSRASLDWAQNVLFPQAIAGNLVVVCLRAARFWGLDLQEQYGEALFAPAVTRGGYMQKGPMRDKIIRTVKAAVA